MASIGAPGLHFHDLRHTGNHLAARTGATTKDLMTRMGHDDMRAALIYQHATGEADRQIADRLSDLVDEHQRRAARTMTTAPRVRWSRSAESHGNRTAATDHRNDEGPVRRSSASDLGLCYGADDGNRTRVSQLGKLMFYH